MNDIWNPWHGCHKYSEGCKYCYMYYLDSKRDKDGNIRFGSPLISIGRASFLQCKMNTIEFTVIQMYAITITTNTILVKPNNDQTKYVYVSLFASIKTFQSFPLVDQLVPLPIQMKIPKAKAIHKVFTKAAHKAALKLALALIVNLFVAAIVFLS